MTIWRSVIIQPDDIEPSITADGLDIEFEEGGTCYTLNLTGKACATLIDYIFDIFHPSDEMLVKIIEARLKRRDAQ